MRGSDTQVELVLTCEEYCGEEGEFAGEQGAPFALVFAPLLKELYDGEVVGEEALLAWADEKQHASQEERAFLNKVRLFPSVSAMQYLPRDTLAMSAVPRQGTNHQTFGVAQVHDSLAGLEGESDLGAAL